MYATFELGSDEIPLKGDDSIIRIDANIQSMSWMNKSQAASSQSPAVAEYKKLFNHQEGWLATGNSNAMVGCTFTTCLTEQQDEYLKQKEKQFNLNKNPTQTTQSNTQSPSNFSSTAFTPGTSSSTNNNNTNSTSSSSTSTTSSATAVLTRTNFNLRGHKTDIKLVRWNEPYQKLASCDSKGVIYVWVKYEGRWSIELINDRGNSVSDFAWSHDGKMAAICYQDGFVLVGSVNGQRFWSQLYDLPNSTITCATWAPNDNFVLIGLSNGSLMVVDEHGTILTRHYLKNDSILSVQYNAPRFFTNHEDVLSQQNSDEQNNNLHNNRLRLSANLNEQFNFNFNNHNINANSNSNTNKTKINNNNYMIACLLKTSCNIYLLKTYDDLDPIIIDTMLEGVKFEWSNCGKYLAVGGYEPLALAENTGGATQAKPNNFVHFYNQNGVLIYRIKVPSITNENILNKNSIITKLEHKLKQHKQSSKPDIQQTFSALTWGHNDQRLFVACSSTLHILRIFKDIPKLSQLTQVSIKTFLREPHQIDTLNLPNRLKEQTKYCYLSTIKSIYPKLSKLRKFVCSSLPNNERLHCTLKCLSIDNKNYDDYYVLYLEYLGGLIPLLTARKSSKLKPNFVIFDPFLITKTKQKKTLQFRSSISSASATLTTNNKKQSKVADDLTNRLIDESTKSTSSTVNIAEIVTEQAIITTKKSTTNKKPDLNKRKLIAKRMNETKKLKRNLKKRLLVEIRSNIWGTKFEFIGQNCLPSSIGQIVYKTSLFHLQPRQMKITLDDLTPAVVQQPQHQHQKQQDLSIPTTSKQAANKPPKRIVKSNTFDPSFTTTTNNNNNNSLHVTSPAKLNKNLISIQRVTSATLGAIPSSNSANLDEMHLETDEFNSTLNKRSFRVPATKKINNEFDLLNQRHANLNELTNCSEKISTVQQLIENKFDKNDQFFCTNNSYNLPILSLVSTNDKLLIENYIDTEYQASSEYLFTSLTSANIREECDDHDEEDNSSEINLISENVHDSSASSVCMQTTLAPSNRRTSLMNFYSKLQLNQSKRFNLLNRLSSGDFLFSSSSSFFNFLRGSSSMNSSNSCQTNLNNNNNNNVSSNKKNARLVDEYQKLEESNFNSIKIKTSTKVNTNRLVKSNETDEADLIDDENLNESDNEKLIENSACTRVNKKQQQMSSNNNPRQFTLHNKPPIWNETNQVYQLDFGGRVTQESAKNFQIEYGGKQVMQFGRIDSNAYTLDFEWPFTAVQAFSIALANITQRLK